MNWSVLVVLSAAALTLGSPARALQPQASQPASQAVFKAFTEKLVGTWNCSIKEYDDSRTVKWSDEQVRVFERSFLGNAIEERAYKTPKLERRDNFGLQVLLLQRPGFRVTQYGIWPGGAARIFVLEGTLRQDGSGFDGAMIVTDEHGKDEKRRVSMTMRDASQHVFEVYSRNDKGTEYLREELVYKRT